METSFESTREIAPVLGSSGQVYDTISGAVLDRDAVLAAFDRCELCATRIQRRSAHLSYVMRQTLGGGKWADRSDRIVPMTREELVAVFDGGK